jgi:methionine synthase II (cobalamin-independent)
METKVDVISFDAYDYGETIGLYQKNLKKFLDRGGILSFGIVPASNKINQEGEESIKKKLNNLLNSLLKKGFAKEKLTKNCLITPSCGLGNLKEDVAKKILNSTKELSNELKEE